MSEQTQKTLSEAFELIEADKLDEARAILVPMLTTHRDNPDVWWLYAHAVTDVDTARMALYNVMRLDPNYPDASELLDQLEKQAASPRDRVAAAETEPAFLADIPATLPDLPDLEDEKEFEAVDLDMEEKPEQEPASRSRLLLLAALGVVAVLVIVAIALLTSQPRGPVTPTPTSEVIAAQPSSTPLAMLPETTTESSATLEIVAEATGAATIEATEEAAVEASPTAAVDAVTTEVSSIAATEAATAEVAPTLTPTETEEAASVTAESVETLEATAETLATQPSAVVTSEVGTPEVASTAEVASANTIEVLSQALSDYTLAPGGIGPEQTRLGNTMVAGICTDAGLELRSTLPAVMDIISKQPLDVPVDAVGVRLTDCASDTTLRLIVVPLAAAQSYAAGSLSEEDFQAQWKSI